jgi:hypothetical protein
VIPELARLRRFPSSLLVVKDLVSAYLEFLVVNVGRILALAQFPLRSSSGSRRGVGAAEQDPSSHTRVVGAGQQDVIGGQPAATNAMMFVVNWSWVATADLVAERCEHARELAGSRLSAVSYILIDYGQLERGEGSHGPRLVAGPAELASPQWRSDTFDWADHAVKFRTATGRVFTCSWDPPGGHEGIWLREVPARGAAYARDADVAVWDVSHAGRWDSFIGVSITAVMLHYRRWPGGGWRSRIAIDLGGRLVHLLLGDAGAEQQLVPSSDNIAVLFPGERLPSWELGADQQIDVFAAVRVIRLSGGSSGPRKSIMDR